MNQRQSESNQKHDTIGADLAGGVSRRRMLRRGLGVAAPVVATLASGPVSAGSCLNPSGFASMATFKSRHPGGLNNCSGKTPTAWHQLDASLWPSGVIKADIGSPITTPSTKFNDIFGASFGLTGNPSLDAVLQMSFGAGTAVSIAPGIVALWLDAKANLVGTPAAFTPAQVVTIWQNIYTNLGAYKPSGGTVWTSQQTVDWITLSWT